MQVYLIRHAQSENNALTADAVHRRKVDPGLTELGYQQRERLADWLGNQAAAGEIDIGQLYTSAMARSLLTSQPLGEALGLRPAIWLDIHEKGGLFARQNGQVSGFGGMTRAAIRQAFPRAQLTEAVTESGWYDTTLGMEPETHSHYRALKVAGELRRRADSQAVAALVSHAGFLDVLIKALFDQLPSRAHTMRYYHNNTAITRIDIERGQTVMHYLNRVDHLPMALRSW
ncbi:MAG: histidine phosphatase family protein [Chloroflexi bacterium]|nr:histidine phosphatase family protein [Chloroflexota bacterium]MCY3582141.1 histidine phosphatase family protein [Chloroflexota bacterium]MCY3716914.1 histidine phosphatase family protein [Chloroflexota bacterium]MDE2649824.1 histidine phosphatase family protein [Chloroflexota bacterium]MXV92068.1 histidine phosphatase family protein [Chloroflexota bacterium]